MSQRAGQNLAIANFVVEQNSLSLGQFQGFVFGSNIIATVLGSMLSLDVPGSGASGFVPAALSQSVWYVSPATGNDSNTGSSAGQPLKTVSQLRTRWGQGTTLAGDPNAYPTVTVNLLDNVPSTDPLQLSNFYLGPGGVLVFRGQRTTVHTGSITAVTQINRATNTPTSITDGALANGAWAAWVGKRLRIVGGPRDGATAFVVKDLGGKSARVSPFNIINPDPGIEVSTLVQAQVGDTYVVEDLTEVYVDEMSVLASSQGGVNVAIFVTFVDCYLRGDFFLALGSRDFTTLFQGCRFESCLLVSAAVDAASVGCGYDNAFLVWGGQLTVNACGVREAGLGLGSAVELGGRVLSNFDTLYQATSMSVGESSVFQVGNSGFFDSPSTPLQIGGPTEGAGYLIVTAYGGAGGPGLYGSGNTSAGVTLESGGKMFYDAAAVANLTLTGASDFTVGGQTSAFAFDETTNAWTTARTCTWAHLAATIAGGGFAGAAVQPNRDSLIGKL